MDIVIEMIEMDEDFIENEEENQFLFDANKEKFQD